MKEPRLLVFASGSADIGGSGFEKLVLASRDSILEATIVAVVSQHENGGVRRRADALGIPFIHFPKPWSAEGYRAVFKKCKADFVSLSGWQKPVLGLDPQTTFNIHPAPLTQFGGHGMYGHHVHEAVMHAFRRGEITHSAICMHFVTAKYDRGPIFFRCNVRIREDDTPDSLGARVNMWELRYQPAITNLVVNRAITWDGRNPLSLTYPHDFRRVRCAA